MQDVLNEKKKDADDEEERRKVEETGSVLLVMRRLNELNLPCRAFLCSANGPLGCSLAGRLVVGGFI